MEPKLHIAVDLDDVIIDFFQGCIDAMYREFGIMLLKEDVTTWDDNQVKLFPWQAYGFNDWLSWLQQRDWLWATFPAIPGAVGGLAALRDQGHHIEILTSKPQWAEPQVWRWLGRWRLPVQQVTIVPLDAPKSTASECDVLIDDKVGNIEEWCDSDEDRLGILYDQPWNRSHVLGERQVRVAEWHGVLDTIAMLENV